jgi:hypothetical protein
MKTKNILRGLALAGVLHLGMLAGSAQTYIYTYTGNDFTSASGPYTTSDKITANLVLSAPLGAHYEGSPTDLIQSFSLSDGVNELVSGSPGVPVQLLAGSFETDSAGVIVGWDFGAQLLPGPRSTNPPVFIQTMTFPFVTNVVDQASIGMPPGELSAFVQNAPGEWVETIVPEPSVGLLFVSFTALLLAFRRSKPLPPHPPREVKVNPLPFRPDGPRFNLASSNES